MPVPCQLIKPLCLVIGTEKHTALGMSPLGVPLPNPATLWISAFTIYNFIGDAKSEDVLSQAVSGLIKRGHDSKFMRPHLTVFAPPLPSVVPIPIDLGLMAVVIAFGSAKTAWGPYAIKASIGGGAENPAVNLVPPVVFAGAANFMVCSEPCSLPNVFNIQVPNTVMAGMAPGDVIGNLVSVLLDLVVAAVLKKFMEWGPIKGLSGKLSAYLSAKLSTVLAKVVSEKVMKKLLRQFIEEAEKEGHDVVARPIGKLMQAAVDKIVETVVGELGVSKGVETAGDKAAEGSEDLFAEGEGEGEAPEVRGGEGGASSRDVGGGGEGGASSRGGGDGRE